MQRRVGGIQVQHDLARCARMRFQKEVDQQFVERFGGIVDLVVAFRAGEPTGVSSKRFSVLLPASGSPKSFFPANTPNSGSCRSCS